MSAGLIPYDDSGKAVLALWDDNSGKVIPVHIGQIVIGADGNKYAKLDVDVTVSIEDVEPAGYIALTSPPPQTNAGTETVLTFSQQVNRVEIYNGSQINVNYAFDTTCTAGSLVLPPGYQLDKAKKVTAVHLLTSSAININGSSSGNIIVLGSL